MTRTKQKMPVQSQMCTKVELVRYFWDSFQQQERFCDYYYCQRLRIKITGNM